MLKQTEDDPGNVNTAANAQAQENARKQKAAELEQQRTASARARNTTSSVQSQMPARARQATDLAGRGARALGRMGSNYLDDMRNTALPISSKDVLRQNQLSGAAQGARADAKSGKNTYYQDVYGVDPSSSKELGGAIAQDRAGYEEFLESGAEGLDTKDVATQGWRGKVKGALGFGPTASDQARASSANLELYRQQQKQRMERDKMADEATARAQQTKKPMGGQYDALLEAAGKLEQPALDDKGKINPAFVEEAQTARDVLEESNQGLSQQAQEQLQAPSSTQSTDWQGEIRDDGQATFGSSIVTDGSEESPAAKAAREAEQKRQANKPKTKQTKLGRNLKGHWLPGYGGSKNVAAVTNLERTKNVRQDLADKRKREQESMSGKQGTLDV